MQSKVSMHARILYVITKANWGGAQHYVYDLACAARDKGYPVAVAYGLPGELSNRLTTEKIPIFPMTGLGRDVSLIKDFVAAIALARIIKSFKPDVVHLNSSKAGALGAVVARLLGVKKIIFTGHAWAFNEQRPFYERGMIACVAWITILFSTHTIVVSEAMRRQIVRGPLVSKKVSVIPNGVRPGDILERMVAREALTMLHPALTITEPKYELWVGTVAELHPVKGLSYAIEAMQAFRDRYPVVRYIIIGEGHARAALEKQIMQTGLQHNVFLLGQVKDASKYMKAFDLFLLPSLSESFGVVLLEAGHAERAVVATKVGGIPEIIVNGETGILIPAQDQSAIVYALSSLLGDESYREKLGASLHERVESEFSIERVVRETFDLY